MLKKIISYAIIFSIFYSDALFCMDDPAPGQTTRYRKPLPPPSPKPLLPLDKEKSQPQPPKKTDPSEKGVLQNPVSKKRKPISLGHNQANSSELLYLLGHKPNTYSSLSSTPSPRSDELPQGSPSQKEEPSISTQESSSLGLSRDGSQDSTPPPSDGSLSIVALDVSLASQGAKPQSALGRRPKLELPPKAEQKNTQGKPINVMEGLDSDSDISDIEFKTGCGATAPFEDNPTHETETKNSGKAIVTNTQELQEVIDGESTEWHLTQPINEEREIALPKFFPKSLTAPYVPENEMNQLALISSPNIPIAPPEEGALKRQTKTKFEHILNTLDDTARSKLTYLKQQILDQSLTKAQWVAVLAATLLAMVMTVGMIPVYSEGVNYVKDAYKLEWLNNLEGGDAEFVFISGIILTIFPNALVRDIDLLKKAATSVMEEGIKVGRSLYIGLESFFPSVIQPFFLIKLELHNMKVTNTWGWDNQFAIAAVVLGTALFFDSWFENYHTALEMDEDFIKLAEWSSQKIDNLINYLKRFKCFNCLKFFENLESSQTLHHPMPTGEERERQTTHKHLNALVDMLPYMTEEKVDKIFNKMVNAGSRVQEKFPGLEADLFETGELVLTLHYLMKWGQEASLAKKYVKSSWLASAYECAAEAKEPLIGSILVSGTFMRVVALQLIGETLLGILCSREVSEIGGWVFSALGTPFLTYFQYKGMNKFCNEVLSGHSSLGTKITAAVKGGLWTLPLFVLCLEACDKWWGDDTWMLAAIPYLTAEFMTLTAHFHGSCSTVETSTTKFHSQVTRKKIFGSVPQLKEKFGSEPTLNYKINYIRERVQGYQRYLPDLNIPIFKQLQNDFLFKKTTTTE